MLISGEGIFNQVDKRFRLIDAGQLDTADWKHHDIVGLSFYHNFLDQIQVSIDRFEPLANAIWVYLSEPTAPRLTEWLGRQSARVQFFGDAVLNAPCDNWNTVISWFISPVNWYAESAWAKQLLEQIQPLSDSRPFLFDCLLGRARYHRDLLWHYLQTRPDRDLFYITYYRDTDKIDQLGDWSLPVSHLNAVRPGPRVHDLIMPGRKIVNRYSVLPVHIYNQSAYSIVAETTAYNEHNQYTEKVAKPMIARRPFVVYAGQHYLRNLRSLGFRTFDPVIDESYDSEPDPGERLKLIGQAIDHLLAKNPTEVYQALDQVLEHNQRHFLQTDWWSPVKTMLDLKQFEMLMQPVHDR